REVVVAMEQPLALLVQMRAIPRAHAPPTLREDADAAQEFHRIVRKRILRARTDVVGRLQLDDGLEVFIDREVEADARQDFVRPVEQRDRKSTRLNSSHSQISYAVFCLK